MAQCKLSVNINKIATLRNSRGGDKPNLLQTAKDLIRLGAEGITVHPRPDERHIRKTDVFELSRMLRKINAGRSKKNFIEFNIEGYPSKDFIQLIRRVRPQQVTLVPDPPHVITSNAGWQTFKHKQQLKKIVAQLQKMKVRVSLFIDPHTCTKKDLQALAEIRPDRIELYTEKFAKDFVTSRCKVTTRAYARLASAAQNMNIAVNAGHDLDSKNIYYLLKSIPEIIEVSIGHALISEALYLGFKTTLVKYKQEMRRARRPTSRA